MKDILEDIEDEVKSEAKTEKKPTEIEKKPAGRRRGVWKKVKVHGSEGFETAETQNIGKHLYNSVNNHDGRPKNVIYEDKASKVSEIKPKESVPTEKTIETTTFVQEISKDDVDETVETVTKDAEDFEAPYTSTTTQIPTTDMTTTEISNQELSVDEISNDPVKMSTSQKVKVTSEICYRGRCIKTDDNEKR